MFAVFESRDDAGRGMLHIVDTKCEEPFDAIPNARVARNTERLMPPRLLVLTGEGELLAFDPAGRTASSIDENVESVFVTFTSVHALVAGRVTLRDVALEHPRRFGTSVTELTVDSGSDAAAYVDEGSLYLVESEAKTPKHLDDDVCRVRFANPPARDEHGDSRFLAYFSPCAETTLTVYDTERSHRISVGPSSTAAAEVRSIEDEEGQHVAIFYVSDEPSGTISVSVDGGPPAELGPGSLSDIGRTTSAGVYLWIGEGTDDSRLVRWAPDGTVTEVVTGVMDFQTSAFPERALFENDEGERSLLVVEGVKEPSIVARGAPTIGRGSYKGTLFGEVDEGDVGTLRLITAPKAKIEEIAQQVYLSTAELAYAGETVFYLQGYDAEEGVGEFCFQIADSADTYCEPNVTEFLSVKLPERGVVYLKQKSGKRHLFWALIE